MIDKRDYVRCYLYGDGEFFINDEKQSIHFEVIDISASGTKISTKADLATSSSITIKLLIPDHHQLKRYILEGVVLRKETGLKNIYAISFMNLSDYMKIELDEMLMKIISRGLQHDQKFCEDGKELFDHNKRKPRYAIH